jgi:thioredoxin 1
MLLHEFNWKKEVIDSAEPVLVDFWASWCPPCLAMNPTVESLAKDFKVCKVNVDKNQQLAAQYHISSIPAFLIFKGGRVAAQHIGITPEPNLPYLLTQGGLFWHFGTWSDALRPMPKSRSFGAACPIIAPKLAEESKGRFARSWPRLARCGWISSTVSD